MYVGLVFPCKLCLCLDCVCTYSVPISIFRLLSIYYFHCVFIYTVPVCNIMYIVSVLRLLYLVVLCDVFVFRLCAIALIQMLSIII